MHDGDEQPTEGTGTTTETTTETTTTTDTPAPAAAPAEDAPSGDDTASEGSDEG